MKTLIYFLRINGLIIFILSGMVTTTFAQPGTVFSHQKISDTQGGFTGLLDDNDNFATQSATSLGDLDGDDVTDIAVGATLDDDGGTDRGAIWILFLNTDGTVKSQQKISDTEGGFSGVLDNADVFGQSTAGLGDLNGDGVPDLAVGAQFDGDGGFRRGAVWILFLDTDGTVKSHQKISDTQGGFTGILENVDAFGSGVTNLGDLDGDGVIDIAVGASDDDDGGTDRGAVWVLFLNADGTVKSHQKISDTNGGFSGVLDNGDLFGFVVNSLGDLDGDGVTDIAVSAVLDDDGGSNRGATWILFLKADGTVKSHQKISDTEGGFIGGLDNVDFFGWYVSPLDDLDGDGVIEIAVSALLDDDGGTNRGAVWILFLNNDGTVKSYQKISDTEGGFIGGLDNEDWFGSSFTGLGDLDGDGLNDIAVGAGHDDDGGNNRGAVWVLFLDGFDEEGPVTSNVAVSPNPVEVNTPIVLSAIVDDTTKAGSNIASAVYTIDGGAPVGMVAGDNVFDEVSENVTAVIPAFTEAGVHQICVSGTDEPGNVGTEDCAFLAVYDPDNGFVTGGGWIDSPVDACHLTITCEGLTGKAQFGFVSKYLKGAQTPTGNTEFQFNAGDLDFHSGSYDWLVVANHRAQYKGVGTINGGGNYGFMLFAIDANLTPSTDVDLFRIQIWDKDNSDIIVYDNELGGADNDDLTTEIGGGSIMIHTKGKK